MYVPTVVDVVVCSLAVYTSRAAGVLLDCNRAFTALTGYTQEEVRSIPVHTGGMDYVVGCVLVRVPVPLPTRSGHRSGLAHCLSS